jgi:bifunctional UDP-N-acetylglucosamine pyrophosphorylase/glucosamine-1-phosphate N-acetyltransferase
MSPHVVICARDDQAALLDCEAAGQPVRRHLSDGFAALFGGPLALPAATPLRDLPRDAGILIVDGRAWLPRAAAAHSWSQPPEGAHTFRVMNEQSEMLAVYLDQDDLRRSAGAGALDDVCEQVLDGTSLWAREAPVMASAGVLVDGYDDVARLESAVLQHRAAAAMSHGVWLRDPSRVYIRGSLVCGVNVRIDVDVIFEGDVVLSDNVRVDAHCIVRDANVHANTWLKAFSLVEGATIGTGCVIGPYARIRPASSVGDTCQIGNFVEIKSSTVGAASRINHHSFIGDAVLGDGVTIGAGTITCNHDGTKTTQTIIGPGAYIGSGCKLVAPLRIGDAATVGAGSTITEDVPTGTLTLARTRQITIPHWRGPRSARHER